MKIFKMKIYCKLKIDNCKLRFASRQRGASLMELLIYIAVLVIMAGIISGIFIAMSKGKGASEARTEVTSGLRFVLEKMAQDLRSATSSVAIMTPSSTTTPPTATLTIQVGGDTITYSTTTDHRLKRYVNSNYEIVSADMIKINTLTFKRLEAVNSILGKTYVNVEINASASHRSDSPDAQYSETVKTTVGIRN